MTALVELTGGAESASAIDIIMEEHAGRLGNALAVLTKIHEEPGAVRIANCERSLQGAAMSLKYLWDMVQDEKRKRQEAGLSDGNALSRDIKALTQRIKDKKTRRLEHA